MNSRGAAWTPIGHNDAISWPELAGLFMRRDIGAVRQHLLWLRAHGVTCIRVMLEYAQLRHRYLERPVGRFVPSMVKLWDDLFALCEETGMYLLITPFDTFFTWRHWHRHPYNAAHGGPCADRRQWLTCTRMREAIRHRLDFATRRWGGSPALFAWDLWNELHPAHAEDNVTACAPFVTDLSQFLRELELRVHGRAHLQTVSVFGPELLKSPSLCDPVFRHPTLDFATTHLYEFGSIDDPRDTVAPALAVGRLMRAALQECNDLRPVLDTEHGPIHAFIDRHQTLPAAFDDEYFRHIQWAHFASGGAGGGMRWPNRHPHVLTPGMRRAQKSLSDFLPLIDWGRFRRRNLNDEVRAPPQLAAFACGDARQALIWLLRTDSLGADGRVEASMDATLHCIDVPGLSPGSYRISLFDTRLGKLLRSDRAVHAGGLLLVHCGRISHDVALAVVPDAGTQPFQGPNPAPA
ncbi:hypothetical protein A9977_10515 [Variovorax sp. UMC13]|nr:hypothetical protein [Variovorax sp. UMC13]